MVALERAISKRLTGDTLSVAAVADDLGMSVRTLSRRLEREGLTFRGVVRTLREALATRYLTRSALSQAQIAFMLGFSDQAAFSNAYKSWTGRTPGSVRRNGL